MKMQDVTRRANCRLCSYLNLTPVLELEPTPIGDEYISKDKLSLDQSSFPLTVYQCCECGHSQLLDVVSPEILFRNYTYRTSSSPGLVNHFQRYCDSVVDRFPQSAPGLVAEIGSNEGALLRIFKEKGFDVVGVDPARQIAEAATKSGIPTIPEFFTTDIARSIVEKYDKAQFICANNVYAHADDLREITKGVKLLLSDAGVFVFEVSYLPDMIEKHVFDTVYHEHLCFHSLAPLIRFFDSLDLQLFDAERVSTKGGSIRCFVQHKGEKYLDHARLAEFIALEDSLRIHTPEPFKALSKHLIDTRTSLHVMLDKYKKKGKKIAGFGASTTATTFLYHYKLQSYLEFIADDNRSKDGLFSPGAHIPVVSSDILYDKDNKPDVVVILVWQYTDNIINAHKKFIENGGVFLVSLPEVKSYENL